MHDLPPDFPPRPEFEPPQRRSWVPILLAGVFAVMLAAIFSILTIGYFLPLFILGGIIFGVIFLQYLVWGWWFEKIYRQPALDKQKEMLRDER
jgi:fatty acid desaturase